MQGNDKVIKKGTIFIRVYVVMQKKDLCLL